MKVPDPPGSVKCTAGNLHVSMHGEYTGVFRIEGLTVGYYEIVETDFPAGYIMPAENPRFLVQGNDAADSLEAVLVYSSGDQMGQPISGNSSTLAKIDNEVQADAIVTFGNTPGHALPHTGGLGTNMIYLLGISMIAAAGVLLFRRRRYI